MQYERPVELEQALHLLAQGEWQLLAGGTDYYPALGNRQPIGNILDITAIGQLREISFQADHWRIGAAATWSELIATDLPAAFDGLKLAAREIGSLQIQNKATLVGNICNASPAADGVPPLLTLDAEVEISSHHGVRQLPLAQFIRGNRETDLKPDEMVSAILIPAASSKGVSTFTKLGARKYLVISIAMVAVRLASDNNSIITDCAIGIGACSKVALRLGELEDALLGAHVSDDLAGRINPTFFAGLAPIDDVRATADYRKQAAAELVSRAIRNVQSHTGEWA